MEKCRQMKKIALILASASIFAASALSQTTVGSAIVGYTKINLPPSQYILAGVNFTANGENPTLIDVLGTNQLRAAANYAYADRVGIWSTANQRYQYYAMYTDRQYYPCNTATEWNNAVTSTNPVIPVGTGFWIIPSASASTTNVILISGNVITVATNILPIASGKYQILSYPFSSQQAISSLNTSGLTANANYAYADRIGVWTGTNYQYYGLYTDRKWYPCNTAAEWNNAIQETDYVISMGEGFWFIAQPTTTALTETNKYLNQIQ